MPLSNLHSNQCTAYYFSAGRLFFVRVDDCSRLRKHIHHLVSVVVCTLCSVYNVLMCFTVCSRHHKRCALFRITHVFFYRLSVAAYWSRMQPTQGTGKLCSLEFNLLSVLHDCHCLVCVYKWLYVVFVWYRSQVKSRSLYSLQVTVN